MKRYSSCRGCTPETGRSPTCHTTCEKYKIDIELAKKSRQEIDEAMEYDRAVSRYVRKRKRR